MGLNKKKLQYCVVLLVSSVSKRFFCWLVKSEQALLINNRYLTSTP